MTIQFYSAGGEYGCFSNFSVHPIRLKGKTWPTVEHYFQGQKFPGTEYESRARKAKSPAIAARLGRDRSLPLRRDWQKVKDNIMFDAVLAKFTQHPDIRGILLSTGDEELVEHTASDSYWGDVSLVACRRISDQEF